MDLLIVSDSHGRTEALAEVLRRQRRRPDLLLFLGDGLRDLQIPELYGLPLRAVCGNCDLFLRSLPEEFRDEECFCLEGYRILMTHGHPYQVKGGLGPLLRRAAEVDADAVLFGHTHFPLEQTFPAGTRVGAGELTRPLTLFNPGSLREGSFGTLHLDAGAPLFAHGSLHRDPRE
ncbi:MAG: metallophosphoesterase family protein [Clostridia bacterium]|nr:metallophosphoesterase family protein [Clostridia bacterium]